MPPPPVHPSLSLFVRLAAFGSLLSIAVSKPSLRADPVTPEARALISAAIPATAPAKPAKERCLLIYTQTKGYRHASIETGVEALSLMGERTGAYRAVAADKPAVFTPESLRGFDAIVLLSTTGEIFDTVETQHALLDYVRNGGGVVGIHGATDSCYNWPQYGEMIGGYFISHPWTHDWNVTVWNEDPTHPLNAAFKGAVSFAIQDEIYQLKDPYSRGTHRVILSLDIRRSGERHPDIAPKIVRTDNDFAISQLRIYEKGRVFYCSLGHNHAIYWNPSILAHYLAGIQWAMGDLQADATPRKRPTPPLLASDPALYEAVARTGYDADQSPFEWLDHAIAEAKLNAATLATIESRLATLLASLSTTPAARQAVAQRLAGIIPSNPEPGRESLQILAPLLLDASQVNVARLALEPIPGGSVDRIFLDAMARAEGEARNAIISSVGVRRMAKAVPGLRIILEGAASEAFSHAATALGRIATEDALAALESSLASASPAIAEAILAAADRLPPAIARKAFARIEASPDSSTAARLVAFRGMLKTNPGTAVSLIIATLRSGPPDRRDIATEAIYSLTDPGTASRLGDAIPSFDARTQIAVLHALARRGESQAVPAVLATLKSPDEQVRIAGLHALAMLPGTPAVAHTLAAQATQSSSPMEIKAANQALADLNGAGVDQAVLKAALHAGAPARVVFIRQLSARALYDSIPSLLAMRTDADPLIRNAALESLEILAGARDQGPLLDWALEASDAQEKIRAVRTLIATTLRNPDLAGRNAALIDRLAKGGPSAQFLLLPALPRLADRQTLAAATKLLDSQDPAVVKSAVSALVRWPDPGPLGALRDFAENPRNPAELRTTAVSAAVSFFKTACQANPRQVDLDSAARLLAASSNPTERNSILFQISRTASPEALRLAGRFTSDPALAEAAKDAILAIRANQEWPPAFSATAGAGQLKALTDNSLSSAWTVPAVAGQEITIDLKRTRPIHRLTLDRGNRLNDYPPAFEIHVTDDPASPGQPSIAGVGSRTSMDIQFPETVHGRYVVIRITTARAGANWSIAEFGIE
ncbi:MAG: ThuA domain-containing protein [Opitutaceae bacterium]|nr:ThuA domain-containing protein [Opitutaceae bacterium]